MKKFILLIISVFVLGTSTAWAIDLNAAKKQGLVGETPNGYLEAVKSPTPEVKKLIKDVNGQRRAVYEKSAKQNNISLKDVEALAGQKAFNKTRPGNYIKVNGKWVKK